MMFKNKAVDTSIPYMKALDKVSEHFVSLLCDNCGHPLGQHDGWECQQVYPEKCAGTESIFYGKPPTFEEASAALKDTNPKDALGSKKAPMSTLPAGVLAELGVAMLEGKAKYGAFNYRIAGIRSSVYYDAMYRHMLAWWDGEDIDPDSGLSHVTKAIVMLVVLRDAMRNGMLADDRPPISPIGYADLNAKSAAIIETHKDKSPRHYTREDKIGGDT